MASKKKSKRNKAEALPVPEDLFSEEKRRPGRPKKVIMEAAPPVKRKPGRPRKNPEAATEIPVKRKPGRPRKNPLPDTEVTVTATPKRKPGRPKKSTVSSNGSTNGHGYEIKVKLHGGATLGDIVRVAETLKSNPAVKSIDGTFF